MDNRHISSALGADTDERSIPEVLKDIGIGLQQMVQSEFQLAKMEVAQNAKQARSSAIAFACGGLLCIYGLGFILLAAMFALEIALPTWLSALIISLLALVGAGLGISLGRHRLKSLRPPAKTIQTVKEDLRWMSEQPR